MSHWEYIHGIRIVALLTEPLNLLISKMWVAYLVLVSTYIQLFFHIHVHIQSLVQKMERTAQFCRTSKCYFGCENLKQICKITDVNDYSVKFLFLNFYFSLEMEMGAYLSKIPEGFRRR